MRVNCLIASFLLFCGPASAQQTAGDAAAGHTFALKSCSDCHVVDARLQDLASDAVPSFTAIAANKDSTPSQLRTFLQKPHGQMPDLQLSRVQIDNVIAYIVSLRRR